MAVVTICNNFGTPPNKTCHCFPIYLPWSDGTRCHDLSFLNVSFKPTFSLSSFTFSKRLFSSSLLSAIRNHELPEVQTGFRKIRGTRDQISTSVGSLIKQDSSRKTSISASLTMPKPLTVWTTTNWKIFKEMGIPDHLTCLLRNLCTGQETTVRTGHRTTDWFQIRKGVCQGCICHPAYLTSMQSTSWETLGQMKHKLESRLPRETSISSDMQMIPPLRQKVKKN